MEIVLIIVIVVAVIAFMAKGSTTMKKPNRVKSFSTKVSSEKVMKTIIQFAQTSGYKVDDFNEAESIIVLSDSTSFTSYGYIYPVYIVQQPDGQQIIEVGIKSKGMQVVGLDPPHERCFNGIKTALYAVS